ncbi:mucin-12-like [Penaeus indicus]|uniref:mucin-12-like n=1 Tax=Penaeus indicus TaxID=29960 RepID=UPI00300DA57C
MRVCWALAMAAALAAARVAESRASQDTFPSSFFYNPPHNGGPPEDIKLLLKSQGPGVQRLGSASPVYTLVMERRPPSQPRGERKGTLVTAGSESNLSVNNASESEPSASSLEPDASTILAKGDYSSSSPSKDSGSPAVTSGNKDSPTMASGDFDLSTLLIADSRSPSAPSTGSVVSDSYPSALPESALEPSGILNMIGKEADAFPRAIQNAAAESYDDIAEEATAASVEDLQGARTYAAIADNDDLGEDALKGPADGYDLTENLLTSSTESDPPKLIQTTLSTLPADEDLATSNDGETTTSFDEDDAETPVTANAFIVDNVRASSRLRDEEPTESWSGYSFPTRSGEGGDRTVPSGVRSPANQQEDSDLSASQISADYVPLGNYENSRGEFVYFGQRNDFYHDDDFTLQVLGGDQYDDTNVGGREDPWEENARDSGKETREKDLYFVLEREPEDAGLVTVKLGKSQEAGRARANEDGPSDDRYYAENLYQYHLQDHKTGSYRFGFGGDNQWRHEERRADGVVVGRYGWQDATGRHHTTHYVADARGFRVVRPGQQIKVHVPSSTTTTESPALTALSLLTEGSLRSPIASLTSVAPANSLSFEALPMPPLAKPPPAVTTPKSPATQTYPSSSPKPSSLPPLSQTPRPSILPPRDSRPSAEEQPTSPSAFLIPNNPWALFVTTQTARPLVPSRPPPQPTILFSEASTLSTELPEDPTTLAQSSPPSSVPPTTSSALPATTSSVSPTTTSSAFPTTTYSAFPTTTSSAFPTTTSSVLPTTTSSVLPTTTPSNSYPPTPRPVIYRPLPTRLSPPQPPPESSENGIEGTNGTEQAAVVTGRPPIAHPLPHQSVGPPYPGSWVYVQPPGSQRHPSRPHYGNRPIYRPFRPVNRQTPPRHKVKPLGPLQPNIGASSHYKPNRFAKPPVSRDPETNSTKVDSEETEVEFNELDNLPSASSPGTSEGRYPQLMPGYYRKGNRPFQLGKLGGNATEGAQQSGGEESLVDLINLIKFLVPPTQLQPPRFVPGERRPPRPSVPWGSSLLGAPKPPGSSQAVTVSGQDQTPKTTAQFPLDYAFMDEDYTSQGPEDAGSSGPERNPTSQKPQAIDREGERNSTFQGNIISNEIGSSRRPSAGEHGSTMKLKLSVLDPHGAEEKPPGGPHSDLGALDGGGALQDTTLRVWVVSSPTPESTASADPSSATESASSGEASTDAVWPYVSPEPSNATDGEGSSRPPPPPPPQQGFWPSLLKELYYWPNSQNRKTWPVLH